MQYLIGIGNYYGFDDSIGLRIAEAISERGLDRGFQSIDLGGNLIDLVHYLGAGVDRVLIVDSARMGGEAGEFRFFRPDDVESRKSLAGISTHEGDLLKILEFARAMGDVSADITVLGVEPADVRDEPGLSPVLAARFEEYVEAAAGFMSSR